MNTSPASKLCFANWGLSRGDHDVQNICNHLHRKARFRAMCRDLSHWWHSLSRLSTREFYSTLFRFALPSLSIESASVQRQCHFDCFQTNHSAAFPLLLISGDTERLQKEQGFNLNFMFNCRQRWQEDLLFRSEGRETLSIERIGTERHSDQQC